MISFQSTFTYICCKLVCTIVTESGSPAAGRSKANKEARLVERKICFISEAGNLGGRW